MSTHEMERTELRTAIIQAAVKLSQKRGFMHILRRDVALAAGSAPATVSYHFGSMSDLRMAVMGYAVEHEVAEIVAQGLAVNHVLAKKAPESLKRKAARILAA